MTCVRVPKSRDLIDCSTSIQPMYCEEQKETKDGYVNTCRTAERRSEKKASVISAH